MKYKSCFLRLLALSLVCVLALSLLAGCSKKNEADETTTAPASATPADKPTESESQPAPATNPESESVPADTADPSEPETPESTDPVADREVYTLDELSGDDPRLDDVVASCGNLELNNRQMQIYYYMQFFTFMNQYGSYASYLGLDTSKPLSEQESISGDGLSWEQVFLSSALDQFHQFAAIGAKADAAGHSLSQEHEDQIQEILDNMKTQAANYNFSDVEDYVKASFGEGVTFADYEAYLRTYFYAMSYEDRLYEEISYTDDDLRAFLEAHPDDYASLQISDTPNVNVRHILITPEDTDKDGTTSDAEKAAAKEKAEALLAQFLENPSEDAFSILANENSTDPGSNTNGGLYEDVYPGQMVQTFNDWCFDSARRTGDTGIVETNYGFHIMYFVAQTENYYWKQVAEQGYVGSLLDTEVREFMDETPIEVDYAAIVLAPMPEPMSAPAE